jgi:hypothetical protein
MRYRLYLDESGDHSTSDPADIGKRYLGLVGVAFKQDAPSGKEAPYRSFAVSLDAFRRNIFGEDPPILHREEIVSRSGDFSVLRDRETRERFDEGLFNVFQSSKCWIISVVLDKHEHGKAAYRAVRHPYHYCLHAVMERYCGYLRLYGHTGDVMAESRGRVEDIWRSRLRIAKS